MPRKWKRNNHSCLGNADFHIKSWDSLWISSINIPTADTNLETQTRGRVKKGWVLLLIEFYKRIVRPKIQVCDRVEYGWERGRSSLSCSLVFFFLDRSHDEFHTSRPDAEVRGSVRVEERERKRRRPEGRGFIQNSWRKAGEVGGRWEAGVVLSMTCVSVCWNVCGSLSPHHTDGKTLKEKEDDTASAPRPSSDSFGHQWNNLVCRRRKAL